MWAHGLALAQVGPELASLGARQRAVELAGDRLLRLPARQASLELLADAAAGAEQQRLHRRRRHGEDLRYLGDRAPLELAHDQSGPLIDRDLTQRPRQVVGGHAVLVIDQCGGFVLELHLSRPPGGLAKMLQAQVVGYHPQPASRRPGALPAQQRPVRVEERRLRDVLGIRRAFQHHDGVPVDLGDVTLVERLERPLRRTAQSGHARHRLKLSLLPIVGSHLTIIVRRPPAPVLPSRAGDPSLPCPFPCREGITSGGRVRAWRIWPLGDRRGEP